MHATPRRDVFRLASRSAPQRYGPKAAADSGHPSAARAAKVMPFGRCDSLSLCWLPGCLCCTGNQVLTARIPAKPSAELLCCAADFCMFLQSVATLKKKRKRLPYPAGAASFHRAF